ncbi:MAG: MMPL family transporter [Bacteroidetes bacterium]|nr:MMPL family transporter [Bacteroidota bacterium]
MWTKIATLLLRQRLVILFVMAGITAFLGYEASQVQISYDFLQVVPKSDPDYIYYDNFKKDFGEDGNLVVLGIENKDVFNVEFLKKWIALADDLKKINGIDSVISINSIVTITKDTTTGKLGTSRLLKRIPETQKEADSLKAVFVALPLYRNLIYNPQTKASYIAIKLTKGILKTQERIPVLKELTKVADSFGKTNNTEIHYSGLPYIRTEYALMIQREINFFLLLSVIVTSLILLLFFRSFYNVVFPILIIAVIMTWTVGYIVLLGYKITLLTGLIPPLIVIIGVPNFIYFLNKYHVEYRRVNDKILAIQRMVSKIANVVFLNNTTTAIGFGVLFFIDSPVLKEFGTIAFLMICTTYFATLILMPIVFSFLPPPKDKHTHYLENPVMKKFVGFINYLSQKKRSWVYVSSIILLAASVFGLTKLQALGYILDDVPHKDKLYQDMVYYERNFKGIMPFEIVIDTKKKHNVRLDNLALMRKVSALQDSIDAMPEFAGSMSVVNIIKAGRQAFYNGNPEKYGLPISYELSYLASSARGLSSGNNLSRSLVDSNGQKLRISTKIKDVGSVKLELILAHLKKVAANIFDDKETKVEFTGYSVIFLKGNGYLIENLIGSLTLAVLLISVVIAILFRSFRLVIITLVPNVLAMLITAGIMGFFNIPLKPSTILVFSIAFGIAVDASFYFLVKYRQELSRHNWDLPYTVSQSLNETGFSIIYTSLVLFFGFGIFVFSHFGSTVSLGALTSITILCAMFTNIILIPALLLSFDRKQPKNKETMKY